MNIKWFVVAQLFIGVVSTLAFNQVHGASVKPTEAYCLAEAVYFEARDQSLEGQLAVALVILNRKASKNYPDTVCGVVHQYKQFSYYWDGKKEVIDDKQSWSRAVNLTRSIHKNFDKHFKNTLHDITHGSTHYFNPRLADPYWAEGMIFSRVIGDHVFLRA